MSMKKMTEPVTFEEFITSDSNPTKSDEIQTTYMELAADQSGESVGVDGATYVGLEGSSAVTETVYVTDPLPEGYTMVLGDDGQQYVTIVQDNQTYAIPLAEYQAMQQSGATAFAIHAAPVTSEDEIPQIMIEAPVPTSTATVLASADMTPTVQTVTEVETPQGQPVHLQQVHASPGIKWGMSGGPQSQIKPTTPPKFATQHLSTVESPMADVDTRLFQPIRVDNWGIFLLSRLQAYFQKKEHCDLTIRFPTRNAQIKVHKLVVNACTDYFLHLEREGHLVDGTIDLPDGFTPEAVAPIIRFMYTGRLDVKVGMFSKLLNTANLMQMSVLTKLMTAQLGTPIVDPKRMKGIKRKRIEEDPVRQIKKIRRIEKKFSEEERRSKMQQAKMEALKTEISETIPGKKLPIWKRKVPPEIPGAVSTPLVAANATSTPKPLVTQMQLTPISRVPPGAHVVPVRKLVDADQVISAKSTGTVSTSINVDQEENVMSGPRFVKEENSSKNPKATYGKIKPDSEKPKIPRQIREIQENLTFEKIRRTGAKNTSRPTGDGTEEEPARDMSVEEMREFMEEQRKRFAATLGGGDDIEDDDDYYDNDAEMDYGDDPGDEDELQSSPIRDVQSSSTPTTLTPTIQIVDMLTPTRPILKASADKSSGSIPRKSVRFSLRPGVVPTPKEIDSSGSGPVTPTTPTSYARKTTTTTSTPKMVVVTPSSSVVPKKRGRPPGSVSPKNPKKENASDSLDTTVDEFSRAVQEEEQEERNGSVKRPMRRSTLTPKALAREESLKTTPKRVSKQNHSKSSESAAQMQIVNEILKRNPDLLKENKIVKLKVMSKDSAGKTVYKYITLRTQNTSKSASPTTTATTTTTTAKDSVDILSSNLGLRDVPKVCYTGRRGRPKTIKPGQFDPHASERQKIEERLHKKISSFGTKVATTSTSTSKNDDNVSIDNIGSSSFEELDVTTSTAAEPKELNPSSEAEALSNVASGIAASLGLVAEAAAVVASSEFSEVTTNHHETATVSGAGPLADLEHYDGHDQVQEETMIINFSGHQNELSDKVVDNADKSSKEISTDSTKTNEVVSQLVMEWDEEEESPSKSGL